MNGPHDLGGAMGFGSIRPEDDAPLFHADWEARALGLTLCVGALGHWSLDESRHAREGLPPATYLSASYYEIWIRALEVLIGRHALLDRPAPHPRRLPAGRVPAVLAAGTDYTRPLAAPARFAPGDRVRCRNLQPAGHIRLPGYLRRAAGRIEADHGGFVLPDASAAGQDVAGRLYTVVFDGPEVWGPSAEPGTTVSADLWESYLEPA
jgi:nitrile hydratase subunit beta